jgi:hypothetical protein
VIHWLAAIGFVTNHALWRFPDKATFDGGFNQLYLVGLSALCVNSDMKTTSTYHCHDLGVFATLCISDKTASINGFIQFFHIFKASIMFHRRGECKIGLPLRSERSYWGESQIPFHFFVAH